MKLKEFYGRDGKDGSSIFDLDELHYISLFRDCEINHGLTKKPIIWAQCIGNEFNEDEEIIYTYFNPDSLLRSTVQRCVNNYIELMNILAINGWKLVAVTTKPDYVDSNLKLEKNNKVVHQDPANPEQSYRFRGYTEYLFERVK